MVFGHMFVRFKSLPWAARCELVLLLRLPRGSSTARLLCWRLQLNLCWQMEFVNAEQCQMQRHLLIELPTFQCCGSRHYAFQYLYSPVLLPSAD